MLHERLIASSEAEIRLIDTGSKRLDDLVYFRRMVSQASFRIRVWSLKGVESVGIYVSLMPTTVILFREVCEHSQ